MRYRCDIPYGSDMEPGPLKEIAYWIECYKEFWEERFERLDAVLRELQEPNDSKGRTKGNGNEE